MRHDFHLYRSKTTALLGSFVLFAMTACTHKPVVSVATANQAAANRFYTDLTPGHRLRIVFPILTSGTSVNLAEVHGPGNTITLSATNLAGYETAHYSIEGKKDGKVRLRFLSAQIVKDDNTTPDEHGPRLSFLPPSKPRYVRLVYLIRNSQSDHNMAVTAAKDLAALDLFTSELRRNPDVCRQDGNVRCSWVPRDVAVMVE